MVFDGMRSDAWRRGPDNPPMQTFKAVFEALREVWPDPVAWPDGCDARIFHRKGSPVAIFGAGTLDASLRSR